MRPQLALALAACLLVSSCDFFQPQDVYLTPEETKVLEVKHGPLDDPAATPEKIEAINADVEKILGAKIDTSKRIQMLETAKGERGAQVTLTPPASEALGEGLAGFFGMIAKNPTASGILTALPFGLSWLFQLILKRQALERERGKLTTTSTTTSTTRAQTPGV